MSPTHTRKGQRLYRYYTSQSAIRDGVQERRASSASNADPSHDVIRRLPAGDVELAVIDQLRLILRSPEVVVAAWRAARQDITGLTEREVRETLHSFDELWDELFPAEQARIVQLLIARVDLTAAGVAITLRVGGFASLLSDMQLKTEREAA
jgi:hypothetical protein